MLKEAGFIASIMRGAFKVTAGAIEYATQDKGFFSRKKTLGECIFKKENDPVEIAKDYIKKIK